MKSSSLFCHLALLVGAASAWRGPVQMQGPKLPGVLEGILGVASSKKAAVATSQASKRNSLRTSLAELCITTCSNGRRPSDGEAAEIKSLVRSLEEVNPTPSPAFSQGVDGNWKLLYSDSPGVSSGRLGPLVGRVYQDVDLSSKKYVNVLEVGDEGRPWLEAKLTATWNVVDGQNWEVVFEDIVVAVLGVRLLRQEFKAVTRLWAMTYLDEDLRVMLGRRPERSEEDAYVFVMAREGSGISGSSRTRAQSSSR